MDTRAEGIIDYLDSVGCEEEDTTVILEVAKAERGRVVSDESPINTS